jgi:hypothetical protein
MNINIEIIINQSLYDKKVITSEMYNIVGVLFQSDNINTIMPDLELRLTIMASIAQPN